MSLSRKPWLDHPPIRGIDSYRKSPLCSVLQGLPRFFCLILRSVISSGTFGIWTFRVLVKGLVGSGATASIMGHSPGSATSPRAPFQVMYHCLLRPWRQIRKDLLFRLVWVVDWILHCHPSVRTLLDLITGPCKYSASMMGSPSPGYLSIYAFPYVRIDLLTGSFVSPLQRGISMDVICLWLSLNMMFFYWDHHYQFVDKWRSHLKLLLCVLSHELSHEHFSHQVMLIQLGQVRRPIDSWDLTYPLWSKHYKFSFDPRMFSSVSTSTARILAHLTLSPI